MKLLIILAAEYLHFIIAALGLLTVVSLPKQRLLKLTTLAATSLSLAFVASRILNRIIFVPRPFVVEHVQPLIPHAPDNGFPSDHTLLAATIAAVVFTCNKKLGVALGLLALISGLARVLAKVHHVQDVAGSFFIALGAVYLSFLLLKCIGVRQTSKTPLKKL